MKKNYRKSILIIGVVLFSVVFVHGQAIISNNIQVFPSSIHQSEVSISINKQNPNVLLLSSNVQAATTRQGAYWSTDGGLTWTGADNLPNNVPGKGDPCTAFDADGNGYVSAMLPRSSNIEDYSKGYFVLKTSNNGTSWSVPLIGIPNTFDTDKPMIATDDVLSSPYKNNFYCTVTSPQTHPGSIQFNRSTDQCATFSTPIEPNDLSSIAGNSMVRTGPNGEVYVCWTDNTANGGMTEGRVGFVRSTNGGQTFTQKSIAFTFTGIKNSNGPQAEFGNTRVRSITAMAVDKSNGSNNGRIYIAYAARENGNLTDRSVIMLRWSDNNGTTWSTAKTVSIPNARQSWFPCIAVNDYGTVFIDYFALDQPSGFSTNTYVAISNNGGTFFNNQLVSSSPHTTALIPGTGQGYAGDYISITAHGWKAYAAWMDNRTGTWQNYVSTIDNTPRVGGPSSICGTVTYGVLNLPPGYNVTWSVSPSGIIDLTPNGNQATVTKLSNGNATITISLNGSPLSSFNVTATDYDPASAYWNGIVWGLDGPEACAGSLQYPGVTYLGDGSSYEWSVINGTLDYDYSMYGGGNQTNITFYNAGYYGIQVKETSACGAIYYSTEWQQVNYCYSVYSLAPNPATSELTVFVDDEKLKKMKIKKSSDQIIEKIIIIDRFGNTLLQKGYSSYTKRVTVNISSLRSEFYIVRIFNGKKWTEIKFVKK